MRRAKEFATHHHSRWALERWNSDQQNASRAYVAAEEYPPEEVKPVFDEAQKYRRLQNELGLASDQEERRRRERREAVLDAVFTRIEAYLSGEPMGPLVERPYGVD